MDAIWAPTLACWLAGPGPLLSGQMWAHCYGFFSLFLLLAVVVTVKVSSLLLPLLLNGLTTITMASRTITTRGAANARTSRRYFCCSCCWPRLEASSFLVREHPNYPPAHLQFCAHPTHFTTTTPSFGRRTDFCSLAFIASASVSALKYAALSPAFPAAHCPPLPLFHFWPTLRVFYLLTFPFHSARPVPTAFHGFFSVSPLLPKSYYYVACFRPFFSFIACCLWRRQQLCRFQLHK